MCGDVFELCLMWLRMGLAMLIRCVWCCGGNLFRNKSEDCFVSFASVWLVLLLMHVWSCCGGIFADGCGACVVVRFWCLVGDVCGVCLVMFLDSV